VTAVVCMAKQVLATVAVASAAVGAGGTYAGLTLASSSSPVIPACQGIAGEPPTAAGCVYWNDVYGDQSLYPQLPNFSSASKGLCQSIKYNGGPEAAARGLVFSWSTNQKYMITIGQAEKYVSYVQSSGVCDQPGY
jgi:hypothetical protein